MKAEVVDQVAAGDVKDAEGKDLSQAILDANAKVEDKTVKDGSSLKDAESAVESADTANWGLRKPMTSCPTQN